MFRDPLDVVVAIAGFGIVYWLVEWFLSDPPSKLPPDEEEKAAKELIENAKKNKRRKK